MKSDYLNLSEVKQIIHEERLMYVAGQYRFMKWSLQKRYLIWKCLSCFRMAQYWKTVVTDLDAGLLKRFYAKLAYRYYFRQRNLYSEKSSVEIANHSTLGRRLDIWQGSVVISGHLGDDCIIHGNNVIGNKGNGDDKIPVLDNGVDMRVGTVVIVNILVIDSCKIGANAIVMKDFEEAGSLIVGIPAQVKGK